MEQETVPTTAPRRLGVLLMVYLFGIAAGLLAALLLALYPRRAAAGKESTPA